jgi:hypothetical protein
MLEFCTANLVYLENLVFFLSKPKIKILPEIYKKVNGRCPLEHEIKNQNNMLHESASCEIVGNVSQLLFASLDPSTSRLMTIVGSCIYKYLSGIHPHTLKVSG